jgi:hypothetical protein
VAFVLVGLASVVLQRRAVDDLVDPAEQRPDADAARLLIVADLDAPTTV